MQSIGCNVLELFKGRQEYFKNSICGISAATEASGSKAKAAVEMPRMLFGQRGAHQASKPPARLLDGLRVVIGPYLNIQRRLSIAFF